jgi:hypothetical protein
MQHFDVHFMQAFVILPTLSIYISLGRQLIEPPLLPIKILAHAADVSLLFFDLFIDDLDLDISLALFFNYVIQLSFFIDQAKILIFDVFFDLVHYIFLFEFFFEVLL